MAKFTLFNYNKPGKGIPKDAPKKKGTALYFDILLRRFWKMIVLNLLYIVASLPALIIAWLLSTIFVTWSASLAGIDIDGSASVINLISILVGTVMMLICGSGPASAAMYYILRKYANDTHAWVISEFYEQFKVNFKQGMAAYFINIFVVICILVSFNFYSYSFSGLTAVFFRIMLIMATALFAFMQFYVYQLMAGYKIKQWHIYKSALLLSVAQFGWNCVVLCVVLAIAYINLYLFAGMSIAGLIFLGLLLFSLVSYTQIFMTNNLVKSALADPTAKPKEEEGYEKDDMFE